jgi:hypothetical protein
MAASPARLASSCRPRLIDAFAIPGLISPLCRHRTATSFCVRPRPIALVTTLGPGGIVNAAPFSFFNVFAEDPPLVVLGLEARPDGSLKDTSAHIRDSGAFTVNLVDEALAERMNICSVDFHRVPASWVPQVLPQRRAQQFSCRGSRKRLLRWSAATIRHWKSVLVSFVRRLSGLSTCARSIPPACT